MILPVGLTLYGLAAITVPGLFFVRAPKALAVLRGLRGRVVLADAWPLWTAMVAVLMYRGRHRA